MPERGELWRFRAPRPRRARGGFFLHWRNVPGQWRSSKDPGEDIAIDVFPVAEERLGRQMALRDEFRIDVENPARVDVVKKEMLPDPSPGEPDAIGNIRIADCARVPAIDVENVEVEFGTLGSEVGEHFAKSPGK